MDGFTEISLTTKNLDRFQIRNAIYSALSMNLCNLSGKLLDVGCGKMPYKKYILTSSKVDSYVGLDIKEALEYDSHVKPDVTWDGITMPFSENTFDCIICTEVLEHCEDPEVLLKEAYRVLKPNSFFFFTVPFLWNLHEVPNDQYRFTPFSLERHMKNSGFYNIKISPTGGWHASMAQMMGLWVRRSPLSPSMRDFLSVIFKPIIKYLIKVDKRTNISYREGQMITGLYGIARK